MPSKIKRFKCPYCEKRYEREDLVRHIEKKHIDDLPEGFRPIAAIAVGYMDMPSVPKNHSIDVNYI